MQLHCHNMTLSAFLGPGHHRDQGAAVCMQISSSFDRTSPLWSIFACCLRFNRLVGTWLDWDLTDQLNIQYRRSDDCWQCVCRGLVGMGRVGVDEEVQTTWLKREQGNGTELDLERCTVNSCFSPDFGNICAAGGGGWDAICCHGVLGQMQQPPPHKPILSLKM